MLTFGRFSSLTSLLVRAEHWPSPLTPQPAEQLLVTIKTHTALTKRQENTLTRSTAISSGSLGRMNSTD